MGVSGRSFSARTRSNHSLGGWYILRCAGGGGGGGGRIGGGDDGSVCGGSDGGGGSGLCADGPVKSML